MASRPKLLPLDEDDNDSHSPSQLLTVNHAYAKRLAHNKQREARHRFEELQKRGVVDSSEDSSEDEDEDTDGILPARTEVQIFDTLAKIKKKDPAIYSEEARFFDNDVDDDEGGEDSPSENGVKQKKMKKPIYLKDAIANQLIANGPEFQEDAPKKGGIVTYAEEQEQLKEDFLRSADFPVSDDEEQSGFLRVRPKTGPDGEGHVPEVDHRTKDADIAKRLEEYFGGDDNLDENEKFLKSYFLNKSWVDEDQDRIPSYEEIVGDVLEDEEELEKQDRFEADYNFRFEEGVGSQVMGHSRIVEGSVRRKDDTRRQMRVKKNDRLSEIAMERREELKRLKNIKKKEILEKLERIWNVAGANVSGSNLLEALQEEDLEEEFDPGEYDRRMKEAFGEEYYEAQDADEQFQGHDMDLLEKPDFDAEDELLGLPKDWETGNSGFAAARERANELQISEIGEDLGETEDEDNEGDVDRLEEGATRSKRLSKRKKKGKVSLRDKLAFDKQLEEYYKLDYEDMIGDLPTRFKYSQVKPNMYGLTAAEILAADDTDLNQYVSLKKMAPYVTQEWKPKWRFQVSQKLRKKQALQQHLSRQASPQADGLSSIGGDESRELPASPTMKDGAHEGVGGLEGSKSKKKRRKNGLSLSQSRLIAYGKISLPSKKKKRV